MHRHVTDFQPAITREEETAFAVQDSELLRDTYIPVVSEVESLPRIIGDRARRMLISYKLGAVVTEKRGDLPLGHATTATPSEIEDAKAIAFAADMARRVENQSLVVRLLPNTVRRAYIQKIAGSWLLGHQEKGVNSGEGRYRRG